MNNISIKNMSDCFGCGVCMEICPKNAITMTVKHDGAEYPTIDMKKCVDCGLCMKKCPCKENEGVKSTNIFAAAIKDKQGIKNSASGGIFYELAKKTICENGVVYGAAYIQNVRGLSVEHIRIDSMDKLKTLQGSKYVQSRIYKILPLVKKDVFEGKKVLFSGTPCQIGGLYAYVGNKHTNLSTVEIICHGAPGTSIFEKYMEYLENKVDAQISDFRFRDKSRGWGFCVKATINRNNQIKEKIIPSDLSSYYSYFLSWSISRESCYSCYFASEKRIADMTIGDFNGIQIVHPEMLLQHGGVFDENMGVSCVLLNSINGKRMFDSIKNDILFLESDFEHVSKYNHQLIAPCHVGSSRKVFFKSLSTGWDSVEKTFKKESGLKYIKRLLREIIKYKNFV